MKKPFSRSTLSTTLRNRRSHAGCVLQAQNWKAQYRNTQNQVQVRNQNIFNLQRQIIALQNNPPNMLLKVSPFERTYIIRPGALDGNKEVTNVVVNEYKFSDNLLN